MPSPVAMFRRLQLGFFGLARSMSRSVFEWPDMDLSRLTPSWSLLAFRWPDVVDFWVVDSVVWTIVSALETVALVAMLCYFFVFYGCTI